MFPRPLIALLLVAASAVPADRAQASPPGQKPVDLSAQLRAFEGLKEGTAKSVCRLALLAPVRGSQLAERAAWHNACRAVLSWPDEMNPAELGNARQLAATRHVQAKVLHQLGEYPEAIEKLSSAIGGLLHWLRDEPNCLADAYSDLTAMLQDVGRWREALREADDIRKKAVRRRGSDSSVEPDAELCLVSVKRLVRSDALARRLGEPWEIEYLECALEIRDPREPELASLDRVDILIALVRHHAASGDRQRALSYLKRCRAELESVGDHSRRWIPVYQLSARLTVNAERALSTLDRALKLATNIYGASSPRATSLRLDRAELLLRHGDAEEAIRVAVDAYRPTLDYLAAIASAFPRDQALAFAQDGLHGLHLALFALARHGIGDPALVRQVWQGAIAGRNTVLDIEIDRARLVRASRDPKVAQQAAETMRHRRRLAYLLVQEPGNEERFAEARRLWIESEETLAIATRSNVGNPTTRHVDLADLLAHLPPDTALVSFFRYGEGPASFTAKPREAGYLAFVASGSRSPVVVDLGDADTIETLVEAWRRAQADPSPGKASDIERLWRGMALRRTVWDPIEEALDRPGPIFLVPDGHLHRIPFRALPADRERFLIEKGWSFALLESERDLLPRGPNPEPRRLLLVGGVDYDTRSDSGQLARIARPALDPAADRPAPSRTLGYEDLQFGSVRLGGEICARSIPSFFAALDGSAREVEDLADLWKGLNGGGSSLTLLVGSGASESALRDRVAGHSVVHLATHGFATGEGCNTALRGIRSIGELDLETLGVGSPRSLGGLVLAGANRRDEAVDSDGDGILTEPEVLGLDLRGVEWLVLSACESGLGRLHPGEGVLGLRRAFRVAGAETLVLSLWAVSDEETRYFMRNLYSARFEARKSSLEAWHQANLQALERSRSRGNGQPFDWAGFIMVGSWR